MQPDDKDAALLPRRIDGSFALLHRPMTDSGAHVWISFSPGSAQLGRPQADAAGAQGRVVGRQQGRAVAAADRDAARVADALSRRPPHRGRAASIASALALFALDEPEHCLLRGDSWIFGPEAPYEREGDVGNVAFPCGYTIGADGDTINLYYGAADTSIALATGSIRELLAGSTSTGAARPHRFSTAGVRLSPDEVPRLGCVLIMRGSGLPSRSGPAAEKTARFQEHDR